MSGPAESLVVRAPNHLGDVVMALPALRAAAADVVVVVRGLAPLLRSAGLPGEIIPLDRGATGMLPATRRLRHPRHARGILLTPSFSSALLFRLARVGHLRGAGTDRREMLLDDVVPREHIDAGHRASGYMLLVTGQAPGDLPVPELPVAAEQIGRWRALAGGVDGPVVGIFPGGAASSRRWAPERFAELVRALDREGVRTVVFGGSSERELTRVAAAEIAFDAAGRTDLPLLAAGLASCDILVTNDSGPMHLASAVGTPVLALFGAGNPVRTGPLGPGHRVVRRADLPCVPCVRNTCPRSGAGFILENAERECLNLITPADVLETARGMLAS